MISEQQTPDEWLWLVNEVGPVERFLEIGSYNGNSLLAAVSSGLMISGGIIRSIDLGNHNTEHALRNVCRHLSGNGYDAACRIANSASYESVKWAQQWAPYDLIFVDGDHSYDGVKQDWMLYGNMGAIIAFHDVCSNHEPGPVKLWNEIKNGHRSAEKVADPRHQIIAIGQQGIGIIWRD